MSTIAELKTSILTNLNQLAIQYGGENVDISGDPEKMDHVSRSVDSKTKYGTKIYLRGQIPKRISTRRFNCLIYA